MGKMTVKGVVFNQENKRHIELLNWLENQSTNFSSYVREILFIEYEKRRGNSSSSQYLVQASKQEQNDVDIEMTKDDLQGMV